MKVLITIGCFVLLAIGCLSALNRKTDERTTATATNTPDIRSAAGRDSTIWNVSFQSVAGKASYSIPLLLIGWWFNRRRILGALDTVIGAIEAKECADCKRCVASRQNALANKRVAVVSAKIKNGGPPLCR